MPPIRARALSVLAVCLAVFLGLTRVAAAAEYYVAPTGNDGNAGTMAQPFATLQKGVNVAVAGDTVWIRGGTYQVTTPATSAAGINMSKSGTSDSKRIRYWAYPGEAPVFDFSKLEISTTGYTSGFAVSGSFLHVKGLEIRNVPMNTRSNTGIGINEPAHDDIFEQLDIHHISGTGLFISHGTGGHLVVNCDSHDNYDPTSTQGDGQNADGFGAHYQDSGAITTFRGCRAWWNSDDGWDLISQERTVVIEGSWAFGNGYINSGQGRPADGAGNGYKVGSSKTGVRHIVRNNLAWGNRAAGFYANHSSGGNDWLNNTAYKNGTAFNLLASTWDAAGARTDGVKLTGALAHKLRNNVGLPNKNSYIDGYGVDTASNMWDLGITAVDADFAGVSDSGFMGPRKADGSLPDLSFLRLREGSNLIDKGSDVGLPYVGKAPDLGAYEFGAAPAVGGATGTAGTSAGGQGGSTGAGGTAGAPTTAGTSSTAGSSAGGKQNGGAMMNGGSSAAGSASSPATSTGGATTAGNAPAENEAGAQTSTDTASDEGCACTLVGRANTASQLWSGLAALALAASVVARRRR